MGDPTKRVKVAPTDKKEVQKKWFDLQLARKNFDYAAALFRSPLPKVAYSKRKNGKKKRLNNTSIRKGSKKDHTMSREPSGLSKYAHFFREYMKAGMILNQAEQDFREALQAQEKKKGGSIKDIIAEAQAKPATA